MTYLKILILFCVLCSSCGTQKGILYECDFSHDSFRLDSVLIKFFESQNIGCILADSSYGPWLNEYRISIYDDLNEKKYVFAATISLPLDEERYSGGLHVSLLTGSKKGGVRKMKGNMSWKERIAIRKMFKETIINPFHAFLKKEGIKDYECNCDNFRVFL